MDETRSACVASTDRVSGMRDESVLRQRDFRLLWIGETTSKVGSSVTTVALPLVAVVMLHAGTFAVGALTAMVWLPWLVFGLPAGAWVDRLAHRPVMLVCDVVSALVFVSVPVAAWFGWLTVAQLLVVACVSGCAGLFFTTAYRAYLPTVVEDRDLAAGNALLKGSEAAAQLGGRSVGGLIAQWLGATAGLLADAVSFVVSALCLVGIRAREPRRTGGRRVSTLRQEIAEGTRWVTTDPYLRTFALFGAVANIGLTGYQAVQVIFLVRVLGVGTGAVGALVAASGAGGILGALVATRVTRRWGTARGLVLFLAATLPFGLLIPLTFAGPGLALLVAGSVLLGVGVVVANVVSAVFQQTYCPPAIRGRVSATSGLVSAGASPLGAVLAGALGVLVGVRPTVWIMMGVVLCAGLIVIAGPFARDRDLPTAAPRAMTRDAAAE